MQVILLERIENLGQMGDIVKVKPGFARNYLLPKHKALRATEENRKVFESRRTELEAENLKRRGEAEAVAGKLDGLSIVLIRQAGEGGQLYGSVTARDLGQALAAEGIKVDRAQVQLNQVIKVLGLHPVRIRLHPEVAVTITANVARSDEEAQAQASEGHVVSADEQRAAEEAVLQEVISEVEAEETASAEDEAASEAAAPESPESPESEEAAGAEEAADDTSSQPDKTA
jgi:large subunit ribosomal protein L9